MPSKNELMVTRSLFAIEDLEIRSAEEGKPQTIVGYAAKWEKLSLPIMGMFKEKIQKGAFSESLKSNNVRALWNHNPDLVLGSTKAGTLRLSEDEKGLRFELDPPQTGAGKDAVTIIQRGDVDGMSFQFKVNKQTWDETDPKNVVRTLHDVDLREISPTAFPAYPSTSVSVRSIGVDYDDYLVTKIIPKQENKENKESEFKILKMRTLTF